MPLPTTTYIAYSTLKVTDLPSMAEFYQRVIGLHVRSSDAQQVALGTPERTLLVLQALQSPSARPASPTTGLYHNAFRLPSRTELANWLKHYLAQGAPDWQGASDHIVSEALYLSDPEGNGIEVYCDKPRAEWHYFANGAVKMDILPLDLRELLTSADTLHWEKVSTQADLGHIHLRVRELPATHQFYVKQLGFDLMLNFHNSALFMAAGGYHHHIGANIWQSRNAPALPANAPGLAEFAIAVPDSAALDALQAQLSAQQVEFQLQNGEICLQDPNQITVRLISASAS